MGMSCIAPQPGPAMWVRLNPRNCVALKLYPPPSGRLGLVSGLHWIIPNGMSTPGKSLPPPVLITRASTTDAGSATRAARATPPVTTAVKPATNTAARPVLRIMRRIGARPLSGQRCHGHSSSRISAGQWIGRSVTAVAQNSHQSAQDQHRRTEQAEVPEELEQAGVTGERRPTGGTEQQHRQPPDD